MMGISTLVSNLGIEFETIILVLVLIGSIVFFAKDFRIGVILLFLMSGACFMWFYEADMNYGNMLIVSLISLVVLALSMYGVAKTSNQPGGGFI